MREFSAPSCSRVGYCSKGPRFTVPFAGCQSPASYSCSTPPAPASPFLASCSDTGSLERTRKHPVDQAERPPWGWVSSTRATVSGTVLLKSTRPPAPGVGSSVGCGEIPSGAGTGDGLSPTLPEGVAAGTAW